jgi:SAM-dependent methyltransferase
VTLGLWQLGYTAITAFDFAEELVEQARFLAAERGATAIRFLVADATALKQCHLLNDILFGGALFLFNGLMQIPGRANRRAALRELHRACAPGAPLLFSTHDRDASVTERVLWRLEAERWVHARQDPRLIEFGDRYFEDEAGRTFMHLPNREEILEDLATTGWTREFDAMRPELARESRAVRDFSDECRFWIARRI